MMLMVAASLIDRENLNQLWNKAWNNVSYYYNADCMKDVEMNRCCFDMVFETDFVDYLYYNFHHNVTLYFGDDCAAGIDGFEKCAAGIDGGFGFDDCGGSYMWC